jgi:hypothetical protein
MPCNAVACRGLPCNAVVPGGYNAVQCRALPAYGSLMPSNYWSTEGCGRVAFSAMPVTKNEQEKCDDRTPASNQTKQGAL